MIFCSSFCGLKKIILLIRFNKLNERRVHLSGAPNSHDHLFCLSFPHSPSVSRSLEAYFIFILLCLCPFTEFKQSSFLPCSGDVLLHG